MKGNKQVENFRYTYDTRPRLSRRILARTTLFQEILLLS